jgi:radical SAM protein (TIGR04043 family)
LTSESIILKIDLMCHGVRSSSSFYKGRTGGAGPAGGRYLVLKDTVTPATNVPFQGKFVKDSPYRIEWVEGNSYNLYRNEGAPIGIQMDESPAFLNENIHGGIPVWKMTSIHGTDALGITVNKCCHYWRDGQQCKFCAIEQNIKSHNGEKLVTKTPQQVAETVLIAVKAGFCRHITLTTGATTTPDKGANEYLPILREIKKSVDIPIHVQVEPPKDLAVLGKIYEEGADTIGLHIESLDEKVRKKMCPKKATLKEYLKAWREAEETFGQDQVSTFILIGLGEDPKLTEKTLEEVTSTGVIPFIVPFRPLLGTELENESPPSVDDLLRITHKAAESIKNYGIRPHRNKAGCVRCGACSAIREAVRDL